MRIKECKGNLLLITTSINITGYLGMDKVILFTYFLLTTLVSQVLSLASPVDKGSTNILM